jgi:hypothetical protein
MPKDLEDLETTKDMHIAQVTIKHVRYQLKENSADFM